MTDLHLLSGLDGDDFAGLAADLYEHRVVAQARRIAAARDDNAATAEHLRVLLRLARRPQPLGRCLSHGRSTVRSVCPEKALRVLSTVTGGDTMTNQNAFAFKPATKAAAKLRAALFGPSGSGKTFSSLAIAAGLGGDCGRHRHRARLCVASTPTASRSMCWI